MQLREHPVFVIHELQKWWPPAWVKSGGTTTVHGEIGILTEVKCHPNQPTIVFLRMEHQGEPYMGALIVDDAALCVEFRDFLQNHIGRRIRDIGDLELDFRATVHHESFASESKMDGATEALGVVPAKQNGLHFRHSEISSADAPRLNWIGDASALLGAIVDSSDDAIISKDLNSVITSWNKSAERLFGYTASEAIGQSIILIIPPDRLDEEPKIIEQLKRGERVDHFEVR